MKHTMLVGIVVVAILVFGGVTDVLFAQSTGTVEGSVTDAGGASVANARLTLVNDRTGVKQAVVSQNSGLYRFDYLNPGSYSLEASSSGFRTAGVKAILVELGKTTSVNIKLQVGSVAEEITVTAETPLVNTVDAQVATNVSQTYVDQLPNQSRDVLSFADMAPGVSVKQQAPSGAASGLTITSGTVVSANGSRDGRSNYYLDGSDNSGSYRGYALQFPNPDAVQEVQVTTSNADAEYGRQIGAIVNVVTKSGTNSFHGDGFFFFRNKYLNANDASNKQVVAPDLPTPRPTDYFKEGGATLGGPIIKNKTFFFAAFQRYQNQNFGTPTGTGNPAPPAPTQRMVTGDFGELCADSFDASGMCNSAAPIGVLGLTPRQIYDPTSPGTPIPFNNLTTYNGGALISKVGLGLAGLLPTVANYGDRFFWNFSEPQINNEVLGKVDHQFTNSQRVAVSYQRTWGSITFPAADGRWSNVPAWGPQLDTSTVNTLSARDTWMISPRLIVESRFNFGLFNAFRNTSQLGRDLTSFGAVDVPPNGPGARKYLPNLFIGNEWGNGLTASEGWLSTFEQHNYRMGSTVTWIHSNHQMKFGWQSGYDVTIQHNDQANQSSSHPGFSGCVSTNQINIFDGSGAQNCPDEAGPGVADLVMGYAFDFYNGGLSSQGWSQLGIQDYHLNSWNHFFFAQDEWKLSRRLTLTPGVRYEVYLPARDYKNKLSAFIAGHRSSLYPNAPLGLAFAGDAGVPAGFHNTDFYGISPRIGVAWDPWGDGRTAIRGAVGRFYSENPKQLAMLTSEQAPWYPKAGCTLTNISAPWDNCKNWTGTAFVPVFTSGPPTPLIADPQFISNLTPADWANLEPLSGIAGYPLTFRTPYSDQWNVAVERQLGSKVSIFTGYVGSHSHHLNQNIPVNYARYENDPLTGLPPSLSNTGNRQPYSTGAYTGLYDGGVVIQEAIAKARFDGWQSGVEMRGFHGLQLKANYQYSRGRTNDVSGDITNRGSAAVNPTNPVGWFTDYVAHHQFKLFYTYDLPFFSARDTLLKKLAGGWKWSGAFRAASGDPTPVSLGYDWNYDGLDSDVPDLKGSVRYVNTALPNGNRQWFDVSNPTGATDPGSGLPVQQGPFSIPGGGTNHNAFGTSPYRSVFYPSWWSTDMALFKDFHVTERQYFEIRLEADNVFNHASWGNLDTDYRSGSFGQLQSISGHRATQLGLKYYF